jgi:branched-chain amino acid transport system permease protein
VKRAVFPLLLLALLIALPFVVPGSWVLVLIKILIAALFAMAFNLLSGQAGMLSFGHAAYYAVGAFATLHLMQGIEQGWHIPTPLTPAAGALAGLVVGAVCGAFATLRSGVYFSMITLAIAELFYSVAPNLVGTFGGEAGLSSMRMPWTVFNFGSDTQVYFLVLAWTALAILALHFFTLTPFGRLTLALRENEQRVRFLGYDTYRAKIVVFTLSAMAAGLAGGLLAVTEESANYVLFETNTSASVVLYAFIGGSGVFFGPALGATLLTLFAYAASDLTSMLPLYQGLVFILVMVFAPGGVGGIIAAHGEPVRAGWWPRLVAPYCLALVTGAAFTVALIIVVELLQRFFSLDYIDRLSAAAAFPPVQFAGWSWRPFAPATWLAPFLFAALGAALLRPSIRVIRHAWSVEGRPS